MSEHNLQRDQAVLAADVRERQILATLPPQRPQANSAVKMQPSRKPDKASPKDDDLDGFFQPEFGKPSPFRNTLNGTKPLWNNPMRGAPQRRPPQNPFIDRRKVSREGPLPSASGSATSKYPNQPTSSQYNAGADEAIAKLRADMQRPRDHAIIVPYNSQPRTTYAPAAPVFNSIGGATHMPAPTSRPANADEEEDQFDPDAALRVQNMTFGASDPSMYVDADRANQNIKNLLEGAFDDDTEKPGVRLRSRAKKTAIPDTKSLADKLSQMSVKAEPVAEAEEEDDGTVEGMSIKLLPHQVEGVSWMISKETGKRKNGILPHGGILADDMGLGKTVQSVALILLNPRPSLEASKESIKQKLPGKTVSKCTLVVAPLALIKQWEGEIQSKVAKSHALKVLVHHGPSRIKSAEQLKKYDVVITTYQTLTSEHAASNLDRPEGPRIGCFGVHWYRIMLDEAHSIKNRNAKSTVACCALPSWYRWCLTGTPMQNNLDELQSLIKFLRIKPYSELAAWKDQITQPMKAGRGGLAMARLHHYLNAFMKRRTKDILKKEGALTFGGASKDGVEKKEGMRIVKREVITVDCEFDAQEQQFYDRLSDRAQQKLNDMFNEGGKSDYIGALVLLLRLRQACNHPALIEAAISKDSEAMDLGATPHRTSTSKVDAMDDLASMMGGISMQARNCDVCQFELTSDQEKSGKTRCDICDQNISSIKVKDSQAHSRGKQRVLLDSDDEDEESGDEPQTPSQSPALAALQPYQGSKHHASTKIRHILSILHSETPQHKVIVFSQFTSMLDIIQPHIRQGYVRYDGSMRPDDREAALKSLRENAKTRVLLCSLKCGSLGLNLTAASRVIIVEPFWNPFVEEQAIDRVHRLNQTVDVKVYRLTVVNTVEERILALQEKKRELAHAAIEGGKAVGKLSFDDVLAIFRGNVNSSEMNEADRKFAEKFGHDSKLIDGPSPSKGKGMSDVRSQNQIKPRAREHEVYGRRW